uniref:Uncharacterized protein n=1 Tax=Rangifer tarandus platyrhynchus TaxID=3082113 RepID=A0ACB0F105_RANTA|nr:unnamed protein product [Rangifer tarandus platyrhynchus]
MWPRLPRERRMDGRPWMSREDTDQPWEDGEVEFKVQGARGSGVPSTVSGIAGLGVRPRDTEGPEAAVGQAQAPQRGLIRDAAERGCVRKSLQPVSQAGDSQPVMRGWAAQATLGRGVPSSGVCGSPRRPHTRLRVPDTKPPRGGRPSSHPRHIQRKSRLHCGLCLEAWGGTGVRAHSGQTLCGVWYKMQRLQESQMSIELELCLTPPPRPPRLRVHVPASPSGGTVCSRVHRRHAARGAGEPQIVPGFSEGPGNPAEKGRKQAELRQEQDGLIAITSNLQADPSPDGRTRSCGRRMTVGPPDSEQLLKTVSGAGETDLPKTLLLGWTQPGKAPASLEVGSAERAAPSRQPSRFPDFIPSQGPQSPNK